MGIIKILIIKHDMRMRFKVLLKIGDIHLVKFAVAVNVVTRKKRIYLRLWTICVD